MNNEEIAMIHFWNRHRHTVEVRFDPARHKERFSIPTAILSGKREKISFDHFIVKSQASKTDGIPSLHIRVGVVPRNVIRL
ncbi:hypothetical protein VNO77_00904 [Canavalia gladiata]|uniref:Uncharacterized protein n=1 Tax=Canavalia gladiata TaxID=3824 RepID=A0AAN9MS43_CANGL